MESDTLTPEQQALVDLFDRHVRAEFEQHDVAATMATMTPAPHLNHVPVMTGGRNRAEVQDFYTHDFIPGLPPDAGNVVLSRTVGQGRLVLEIVLSFTHTIEMPWILPGVKPTGRRVEVPVVLVVHAKDGKVESERVSISTGTRPACWSRSDSCPRPICRLPVRSKPARCARRPRSRRTP